MFKKIDLLSNVRNGVIAGLIFGIGVFFYIRETTYSHTWLVYLGSFLFFIMIVIDVMLFNRRSGSNANTVTMVFSSHVTTLVGVVVASLVSFILLAIMVPGYLDNGPTGKVAPDAPINAIHDKTNGLSFRIFIAATIFNFAFGSFASILFPFSIKRNQTKESGEPYPLQNERPV